MLENEPREISIWERIICGLLFVDDLVLIAKDYESALQLLEHVQWFFEGNGLSINCSKSNILSVTAVINGEVDLISNEGDILGIVKQAEKYKYLGIPVQIGRAQDIFNSYKNKMCSKLKCYAGLILSISKGVILSLPGVILW